MRGEGTGERTHEGPLVARTYRLRFVSLYHCRCRDRHVIVSLMVMCNGIVIVEYDGRRPGLPIAPVVIEHNMTTTEQRNLQP